MKLSFALLAVAAAEDKKVPPRHPLQRLERLTQFSAEILDEWFSFVPSVNSWKQKFANNAERMERNFRRGNQRCGYYDENNLPHGGPAAARGIHRRAAQGFIIQTEDVEPWERYDREDPAVSTFSYRVTERNARFYY